MALYPIATLNNQYTALLLPRTLEPDALMCTAESYPVLEDDPVTSVIVRYRGSSLQFVNADGTAYQASVLMDKPSKIDAAFSEANELVYAWLYEGTLHNSLGVEPIANVTGFALVHEDLRFDAVAHTAALYYTLVDDTVLYARYSDDGFTAEVELGDIEADEFLYAAGMNEFYRMHFTLRKTVDISGANIPTPEYVITSGDHVIQYNNGTVYSSGG